MLKLHPHLIHSVGVITFYACAATTTRALAETTYMIAMLHAAPQLSILSGVLRFFSSAIVVIDGLTFERADNDDREIVIRPSNRLGGAIKERRSLGEEKEI